MRTCLSKRAPCPVRTKGSGLDARNPYSERLRFQRKRVRPTFDSVLGRDIVARPSETHEATDRSNVDHVAFAPDTHSRQHSARYREKAEHVRFELSPNFVFFPFFDRRLIPVARIVHEHVDDAEPPMRRFDSALDFTGICHVKRYPQQAAVGIATWGRKIF